VVLVYDPVLSVYAVSRYPDTYFYDGRYYRVSGNTWYRTTSISGPWATVSYQSIPPGLHNKYRSPGHSYVRYKHSKVQQPGHGHHEQ